MTDIDTSAETMEVAEPSIETADSADYVDTEVDVEEVPDADESVDDEAELETPGRDFEKDRAYAELRRAKEDAEQKLKERDSWVAQQFGETHGLHNWDDYQRALAEEKRRQEYSEQGLDYDVVKKAVKEELDSHPEVVKSREANQRAAVEAQIAEFNMAYPEYKLSFSEPQALFKLPNAEQIAEKIRRGYTIVDAFETTNREAIIEKRTRAAQQAARNNINSKQHIKSSGGSGGDIDALSVPDDVLEIYRKMNAKDLKSGKMKESDFIAHYKKSNKK
ncbi:hypothetical protein [Paenibacillus lutrae]|uniref:Scaffolding protein n=1 Tax=Paenibacillus lutrae TaxID=2078573 RepID=A0A7X3JZM9_9BACL|nr:hypothetical protein [Paenibacillus lutrae]MVP00354.1 hypothetical protein [Paenibacillus lutrae]